MDEGESDLISAKEYAEQLQTKVRITVQPEGSNTIIETRSYSFEPNTARIIEETIDLPDDRTYIYTVYDGDQQTEQKRLGTV